MASADGTTGAGIRSWGEERGGAAAASGHVNGAGAGGAGIGKSTFGTANTSSPSFGFSTDAVLGKASNAGGGCAVGVWIFDGLLGLTPVTVLGEFKEARTEKPKNRTAPKPHL